MRLWPGEPGEGWPSWAFSNHDAPRVVSRWLAGRDREAFARQAMLLLMSLQGQRLPLPGRGAGPAPGRRAVRAAARSRGDRQLARDPGPRRRAHADAVAAADCRNAGFSTAEPWLPVDPRHVAARGRPAGEGTRARCSTSPAGWSRCAGRGRRCARARSGGSRRRRPCSSSSGATATSGCSASSTWATEAVDWALPDGWRVDRSGSARALAPLSRASIAERDSDERHALSRRRFSAHDQVGGDPLGAHVGGGAVSSSLETSSRPARAVSC